MKRVALAIITIIVLVSAGSGIRAAEEASFEKGITISETNSITAVVEKIDHKSRTVRLKGREGNVVDLTVSETAKNFDQVKKGDTVTLTYYGSLLLKLVKASQAPASSESSVMQRVPEGQKPKVVKVDTMDGVVTIEEINAKDRIVSVRNPKGELKTHTIGENVTDFKKLKVGDRIYYSYTQALAIEVKSPNAKQ